MALAIGQKAPNFKLADTEKKERTLGEFRGKNVVLFFFPMDWTGTCTKEMCAIEEDYKSYVQLNAVTIGISVDTLFAHKRFSEDYHLGHILLLSDFNKEAINAYGVVHHDFAWGYKDVAKRATFVIDKDGVLRFIEILPSLGDFPNLDAIKKALAAL
jgi:peroxiredoxin